MLGLDWISDMGNIFMCHVWIGYFRYFLINFSCVGREASSLLGIKEAKKRKRLTQ